uniref:Peptidase S1 domain-containing protein n=1 Tax=Megaselia scalaris TaxID=36166 RepID=T1H1E9_MEGSC
MRSSSASRLLSRGFLLILALCEVGSLDYNYKSQNYRQGAVVSNGEMCAGIGRKIFILYELLSKCLFCSKTIT